MFIIQAERDGRQWVSGIFAERDSADGYMALIPDEARHRHSITRVEGLSYPFYIIEDEVGFRFLSESGACDALMHHSVPPEGEGHSVNAILYRVDNDWRPPTAGRDYMGALPHHHVAGDTLDQMKRGGMAAIW
jgi:hypothetical protein